MVNGGNVRDEARTITQVFGVLECNRTAVDVFRNCRWETESSEAGLIMLGITSQEIESAMRLLGVPETERADVLMDVRYMEHVASRVHSDRMKRRVDELNRKRKSRRG